NVRFAPYPAIVGYDPSSDPPIRLGAGPRSGWGKVPGSGQPPIKSGGKPPIRSGASLGRNAQMPAPAPLRPIAYGTPDIVCEKAPDGSLRCRSAIPLALHDPSLARLFRAAVERNPAGLFLAERDASGAWRKLTYEAARKLVDALAQGLLDRGLS